MSTPPPPELAEELILQCLESDDPSTALTACCDRHPELASELRRRFELLQAAGMAPAAQRFGEYEIVRELGRGGMGVVYLAEEPAAGRPVALKLLRSDVLDQPRARQRFDREVEAARRLDHPGLCPVYGAGEVDGQPFLAMRYLAGESLAEELRRAQSRPDSQPSSTDEVRREVERIELVARAAHVAHDAGLIHRDIKPANIMLVDGAPVLLDFGLAADAAGTEITLTGDQVGTPAYMAPEQIAGSRHVDRRADVYALGVTLFQCLTHRLPFQAATVKALYHDILHGDPPSSTAFNPAIPEPLCIVLETAMARDPAARYTTALDLAEDLRRVREGVAIVARRPGAVIRALAYCRRHRALVLATATIALVTSAAAIFSAFAADRAHRARERSDAQTMRANALLDDLLGVAVSLTDEFIDRLDPQFASVELRRDFAKTAVDTLEAVAERAEDDPRILGAVAEAHLRYAKATAGSTRMALLDSETSNASVARAHAIAEQLHEAEPNAREWLILLADTTYNTALVARWDRRADEAIAGFERSIELLKTADAAAPLTAKQRFDIAHAIREIGKIHAGRKDWRGAEQVFARADPVIARVIADDPDTFAWRVEQLIFRSMAPMFQGYYGDHEAALASQLETLAAFEALHAERPEDDKLWNLVAIGVLNVGRLARITGDLDAAEARLGALADDIDQRLVTTPKIGSLHRKRISVLHSLGLLHRDRAKSLTGAARMAPAILAVERLEAARTAVKAARALGMNERDDQPFYDEIDRDHAAAERRLTDLRDERGGG